MLLYKNKVLTNKFPIKLLYRNIEYWIIIDKNIDINYMKKSAVTIDNVERYLINDHSKYFKEIEYHYGWDYSIIPYHNKEFLNKCRMGLHAIEFLYFIAVINHLDLNEDIKWYIKSFFFKSDLKNIEFK